MRCFKVFRSDFTSVWNQPTFFYHIRDTTHIKWKLHIPNTHSTLHAALSLKRVVYWAGAAIEEYCDPYPNLIICEVEARDILKIKNGNVVCKTITPVRIVPPSEYIDRISTDYRFYDQLIKSLNCKK